MHSDEISERSYGMAVILCGVFGVLGIHHFYLRNHIHGFIDFGMFAIAIVLFRDGQGELAAIVLLVDALHTVIVFYKLITEQEHDGDGRRVALKYQNNIGQ